MNSVPVPIVIYLFKLDECMDIYNDESLKAVRAHSLEDFKYSRFMWHMLYREFMVLLNKYELDLEWD